MVLPEDFGLSPVRTLAHVAETCKAPRHTAFWKEWHEAVLAERPALAPRPPAEADPSDPTATHQFLSLRHARIGCRLILPPEGVPVRAGLVTTHGYGPTGPLADEEARWAPLAARGVAVLAVRVRGFPGSRLENDDLARRMAAVGPADHPVGWITHGLAAGASADGGATPWVFSGAVADTVNACRALRRFIGQLPERDDEAPPEVYLHGESLGGALAVIAAARLAEIEPIARLVVALPSMGDWVWRLSRQGSTRLGIAAEVRDELAAHAATGEQIVTLLRYFDAAVHARRVRCPTLGKLALRDEVVPAPSAAAVFNALGADPARKWRYVVACGHFDAGLADLRRHAQFERILLDFLDPGRTPESAMSEWEVRMNASERPPRAANPGAHAQTEAPAEPTLFATGPADGDSALIGAYAAAGRTLDDLPYTPEFDRILEAAGAAGSARRAREVFHRLHNLRKAGKLPRLGRAASKPPAIVPEEEAWLADAVIQTVGTLGQRDQLPYTPEFDGIVERFNARTGRDLTPHDIWRLVAKLAK